MPTGFLTLLLLLSLSSWSRHELLAPHKWWLGVQLNSIFFSLKVLSVTTGKSDIKQPILGWRKRNLSLELNDRREKECDSLNKSMAMSVQP